MYLIGKPGATAAGAAIFSPTLFNDAPQGPFSLNRLFVKSAEAERLFGLRLDGIWMHVGTPAALAEAETWFETEGA